MAIIETKTIPNITAYADACNAGFTGSYEAWCNALGTLSGNADAVSITREKVTLLARGWSNGEYSLEYLYPSDSYTFLFIDKDGDTITNEQLSWWYAADMLGSQTNKIIAHDETPEVDIPVVITLIKKTTLGGGGTGTYQQKTVSPSGVQQNVVADYGYDALSKVIVMPALLQEKTAVLGSAQQITPDSGYYGLSKVNIPAVPSPSLGTKSITANGTYNASGDNLDGYSSVEVNVSGGSGTYQQKTVHPSTSSQSVQPDQGFDALSSVLVEAMDLENKTASASQTAQTITPTAGKDGLAQVEIPAALLQTKTVTLSSSAQQITADSGYYGLEQVNVPSIPTYETQSKTVHPSTTQQTVLPDSNKDALSSVVVEAMDLQTKTVTAGSTAINVVPDSGKDGLSQVTVNALNLQTKQVTPSSSAQIVTADQNYDGLAQVEVAAASIPTLVAKNIIENGTYNPASDNADGYSTVTVAVPVYGGNRYDLLWENPSPDSNFASQTVSLTTTEQYDAVLVEAINRTNSSLPQEWAIGRIPNSTSSIQIVRSLCVLSDSDSITAIGTIGCQYYSSNSTYYLFYRSYGATTSSGILSGVNFDNAKYYTGTTGNYTCIPTRIYGVKGAGQTSLKTKSVTTNGTYTASSDNCEGFSTVTVAVPQSTLGTKSITTNGTYTAAADNLDGFSEVTVNVSGGGSGATFTLLWTNPSPSNNYTTGTVAITDDGYDAIMVEAMGSVNSVIPEEWSGSASSSGSGNLVIARGIALVDGSNIYGFVGTHTVRSSTSYYCVRDFWIQLTNNVPSGVTFGHSIVYPGNYQDGMCIPIRIYGVKNIIPTT